MAKRAAAKPVNAICKDASLNWKSWKLIASRTSIGIESAISSISLAVQRAVDSCVAIKGRQFQSIPFKDVWIALAGYDRPKIAEKVDLALAALFKRSINNGLRISTDIELLVTPSAAKRNFDSIVVLIVGTGSVAMSYRRDADRFIRTGRKGGWGNLLGDDGSGYSIGRDGLRIALEIADEVNLKQQIDQTMTEVEPLAEKIFEHFEIGSKSGAPVDLLNRVLTGDPSDHLQGSTTKRRIADASRVVFNESSCNDKAKAIIQTGSKSLVQMLTSLIQNREINPSNSALVLAGGLIQNKSYQRMILEGLLGTGTQFGYIQVISNPAKNAAQYLL
jgi:N-acetylmuramic acid 6-phosphate etherase